MTNPTYEFRQLAERDGQINMKYSREDKDLRTPNLVKNRHVTKRTLVLLQYSQPVK